MGKDLNGLPSTQVDDPNSYFLRITETGYEPHFRMGDVLIASPSTPIAPGCFVLACLPDGKVHLCQISAGNADNGLVVPLIPLVTQSRGTLALVTL